MNLLSVIQDYAPFVIPGYDQRDFRMPPYIWRGAYSPIAEQILTYQGRTYLLRTVYDNIIVFRDAARNLPEWTYFLQFTPADVNAVSLTPEQFGDAWERGEIGRMIGCKPGGKYDKHIFNLFLFPDGTGLYQSSKDNLDFTWDWRQMGLDAPDDLLAADFIELDLQTCRGFSRYCADIVERQLSKRLKNYYVEPGELKHSPLIFSCGSAEALHRITTWICHSDPDIFPVFSSGEHKTIYVWYVSPADRWKVHYKISQFYSLRPPGRAKADTARQKTLLRLAYKYNTFTGWMWVGRTARTPLRRNDYWLHRANVPIRVKPPSAHERAESLLALSDWLEGKVPHEKKMHLLGLE